MTYLFDIPAYFILLRETLEVTIILAVLLGFIDILVPEKDAAIKKTFKRQIWIGAAAGLALSIVIGSVFIAVFYTVAKNLWEENEPAWGMTRVQQWRKKWERKLEKATESYLEKHKTGNKWALILLPFTVVCREAVETFVFIGGIGFNKPASGLPIPVILGLLSGFVIGWIIYKGAHKVSINIFFTATTVFLLFVAAGMFSTSVHKFQQATGSHETVLWHTTCCDTNNAFWSIMQAIFGWREKATLGTTIGYFSYWACVIVAVTSIFYFGKKSDEELEEDKIVKSKFEVADRTDNV
ncbi:9130_t:CDS:2 [Entrophospora sp. SA101]|nr:6253_t:CDS:2 [Entrophospora sp. SA101]CAJ0648615.1 10985_t:CDS:2 [Entrophospora sp. SA101]CAJ0745451.1 23395_t:CDS:2 [Entrophospora sp. SA101]CAJ0748801.1 5811_t:CDS:2 [Entrophospora sp. SA101]CAJ0753693.1 9130_t:CDS:2 [Entrophospora sp. SA101]